MFFRLLEELNDSEQSHFTTHEKSIDGAKYFPQITFSKTSILNLLQSVLTKCQAIY